LQFPADVRYTETHEWARLEGGLVTVGISGYATEQLGDVVFLDMPKVGRRVGAQESFGVVEAVKTASDLYAPVAGEVVAINEALVDKDGDPDHKGRPELVNASPYGEGWIIRIKPDDAGAVQKLMDHGAYAKLVEEQHA